MVSTLGYIGIGIGSAAAVALIVWRLLNRHTLKSLTSHVLVEEDEELIEAELAELNKLAGNVAKMSSEQAPEEGAKKGAKASPEAKAKDAKEAKPTKKEEPTKPTPGQTALKKVLTAAKKPEKKPKAEKKKEEKKEEKKQEKKAEAPGKLKKLNAKSVDVSDLAKDEKQQFSSMRNMIAKTKLLLRKKQHKKAYVLYLKIRREYDHLPNKIRMKIQEEFNGLKDGINHTIPELEVVDELKDADTQSEQNAMEVQTKFLTLLDQAEAAVKKGEREKAYILYSEIRGMYHIIPDAIKKEVYVRCVDIYKAVRVGEK